MQPDYPSKHAPWHRGLLSLDPLQWIILAFAALITIVSAAAVILDTDPPTLATIGRIAFTLGWPLFTWGILPKMRIRQLFTELGEVARRDQQAMRRRLQPTRPRPRDWCAHIGFTLVFGGMLLFFPDNGDDVGGPDFATIMQIVAAAVLLIYWGGVIVNLRAPRTPRADTPS